MHPSNIAVAVWEPAAIKGARTRRPGRRSGRLLFAADAMIQLNLNPAQAQRIRPQSASLRTPRGGDRSFDRLRNDGQATPRLPAPREAPPPGEEEPWLFSFERSLTTMDVWKMGVRAHAHPLFGRDRIAALSSHPLFLAHFFTRDRVHSLRA